MTLYSHNVVNLHNDDDDTVITIQEDADGLGMIQVVSKGDYYGAMNFSMEPDDAITLANAMIILAYKLKESE